MLTHLFGTGCLDRPAADEVSKLAGMKISLTPTVRTRPANASTLASVTDFCPTALRNGDYLLFALAVVKRGISPKIAN